MTETAFAGEWSGDEVVWVAVKRRGSGGECG